MAITSFAELQREIYPRWCRAPKVSAFLGSLSAQEDTISEWLAAAVTCRLASLCPDDALDLLGATLGLERAPGESHASFRQYLRTSQLVWKRAGTREGMRAELARLWPSVDLVCWRDLVEAGEPETVFGGHTSMFFVRVNQPNGFAEPPKWDGGAKWDDGSLWDLGQISALQRARLDTARRWIARWKPAHMSCRYIEIVQTVGLFGAPGKVARLPVWEPWERRADGQARDLYNGGYK